MKELKSTRILKIALVVYGLLYTASFIEPLFYSSHWSPPVSKIEIAGIIACITLYVIGAALAWTNRKQSAIVLMVQNLLVWIIFLSIRPGRDLGEDMIVYSFPILIMAAFLYRNWHVENTEKYKTNPNARLLLLDALLINYSLIYLFIVVIGALVNLTSLSLFQHHLNNAFYDNLNILSVTGALLIIAGLVYIVSLISLKRNRIITGVLLIAWYTLIVILTFSDVGFSQTGP